MFKRHKEKGDRDVVTNVGVNNNTYDLTNITNSANNNISTNKEA
jgi:hypothetical protein